MQKTTYKIAKMDCLSEENIIRMKLEGLQNITALKFEILERKLYVMHEGDAEPITAAIDSLHFNSSLIKSQKIDDEERLLFSETTAQQKKLLWQVLTINLFFFLLEIITGFISGSMGLVADSLDMFADAVVYGLALFVVGKALFQKRKIAKIAGCLQLLLAVFGFAEVIRRYSGYVETPDFKTMISVSLFALLGNAITLYLLQKSKSKEAHMKASMIFTSTDVIVNVGVMAAGALVYFTASNLPDLIVGNIVFVLVGIGAYRILKL
ncbi:MAG: cation transporter [Bacteroidota bacterium]|nr:cation transporter [Bacteroidota bacterium]